MELKEQVAQYAADRVHDDRVRLTLVDIVVRSCSAPGSVGQDELDRLPRPRNLNFGDQLPASLTDSCAMFLFLDLAFRLRDGDALDAADLKTRSSPVLAIPVRPEPFRPEPVLPVEVIAKDPVAETIKNFRRLAIRACESPEKLTYDETSGAIWTPYIPLPRAQRAGADLSGCVRFVYDALVLFVPQGYGGALTPDWLRGRAQAYYTRTAPPHEIERGGGRISPPPQPPPCYWDPECNCRVCEK